jgi:hypothetical protein
MRKDCRARLGPGLLAGIALLTLAVGIAAAQSAGTPAPPVTAPTATPSGGTSGTVVAIVLVVALLALVVVGGKLLDLRRRREAEAVHLQAQVSDALLREASLAGLPATPVAHIPAWRGTPATLVVSGHVPSQEIHDLALRIAQQEAARIRPDVVVEDRLAVEPAVVRPAA